MLRANLDDAAGASGLSPPRALNQDVDSHRTCERCGRCSCARHVQYETMGTICCDWAGARGSRGLSLVTPFSELKLKAGDRLEYFWDLPDVGAIFCTSSSPLEGVLAHYWQVEINTICMRKCPFSTATSVYAQHCSGLGRALYNHWGVLLVYCRRVVWEFLRSGIWESGCIE